jgi:cyclic di-GMP phosphodiesterase
MTDRPPAILIVDDEEMVLSSLRGVFRLQTDYRVLEANDPKRALEALSRTPVDLVISDFLMPQMNGIEFLKEAKAIQPDSVRVLLTGYADKENAIKAINQVGIFHYMEKPWDNDDLLTIIRTGLDKRLQLHRMHERNRELEALVQRLQKANQDLDARIRELEQGK